MQAVRISGIRRTAITAGMVALLVVLGGCCVYPAGAYRDGGPGYRGYGYGEYDHGGYGRYDGRGHGRHYW